MMRAPVSKCLDLIRAVAEILWSEALLSAICQHGQKCVLSRDSVGADAQPCPALRQAAHNYLCFSLPFL